ncbi:hypothetical protein [Streptomyces sp. NPDC017940]|uniref:hypothetical protein n=1 Tax=Streptomyces sp. NPDC017940 TaxID=3365017 RepID=UPI00378EE372
MFRSRLRPLLLGLVTAAAVLGTTQASATVTGTPASTAGGNKAPNYWSCTVPSGYTYVSVTVTNSCSTIGTRPYYDVVKPRTGLWACTVPQGFTYTEARSTLSCSTIGTGYIYLLQAV